MKSDTTTVLRRVRRAHGLSLRALAEQVGCTHPTILAVEHGRRTQSHPRVQHGLERALGVPYDVLILPDTKNAATPEGGGAGVLPHTTTSTEKS